MAAQKRINPSVGTMHYPGEDEKELATPRPRITNDEAFAEAAQAAGGSSNNGSATSNAGASGGALVPTNLVNPVTDYSGKVVLQGSGNDQKIALTQVCRGYWKEPTVVTVQSKVVFDIWKNNNFFDPTGQHQFAWCRAMLRVTWGVGNLTWTRDVSVGEDFEILANYVQVAAWIGYAGARGGSVTPTNVPVDVSCPIAASITEHRIGDRRVLHQRQSYSNVGVATGDCVHQNAQIIGSESPAPLVLYEISGYQDSANAVYLMLFDTTQWADNFWGSNQALAAGDTPLIQEKIPAGSPFSLLIEGGMSFQKALVPVFSSTPGVFTPTDPSELGPFSGPSLGAGVGWAMNITYDQNQNAQNVGL